MQQFKGVSRKEASGAKPCGSHKAHSHLRQRPQPLRPPPKIQFFRRFCRRLAGRVRHQVPAGGGDGRVLNSLRF